MGESCWRSLSLLVMASVILSVPLPCQSDQESNKQIWLWTNNTERCWLHTVQRLAIWKTIQFLLKKYNVLLRSQELEGSPLLDIVTGTQMSTHSNVLKLIGCCLATKHTILVYEFVGSETLPYYISSTNEIQPRPLSWKCRIKITSRYC